MIPFTAACTRNNVYKTLLMIYPDGFFAEESTIVPGSHLLTFRKLGLEIVDLPEALAFLA